MLNHKKTTKIRCIFYDDQYRYLFFFKTWMLSCHTENMKNKRYSSLNLQSTMHVVVPDEWWNLVALSWPMSSIALLMSQTVTWESSVPNLPLGDLFFTWLRNLNAMSPATLFKTKEWLAKSFCVEGHGFNSHVVLCSWHAV